METKCISTVTRGDLFVSWSGHLRRCGVAIVGGFPSVPATGARGERNEAMAWRSPVSHSVTLANRSVSPRPSDSAAGFQATQKPWRTNCRSAEHRRPRSDEISPPNPVVCEELCRRKRLGLDKDYPAMNNNRGIVWQIVIWVGRSWCRPTGRQALVGHKRASVHHCWRAIIPLLPPSKFQFVIAPTVDRRADPQRIADAIGSSSRRLINTNPRRRWCGM